MLDTIKLSGMVKLQQYRKGQLLRELAIPNKIVWDGKADLLNQFFVPTVTWSAFYMGLLSTGGSAFTDNDPTVGTEFTAYDESARPEIVFGSADKTTDASYIFVQNSVANYATYTISTGVSAQSLYGVLVASNSTKGSGVTRLWCLASFGNNDASPVPVVVNAADVLRVQYTVRIPKA